MKHRSEALSIYKNFSAMIHTHFDTSIRVFHADSVGEYLSDTLRQVLAEQGTLTQFSCPGAHAQNGVAGRKHHYLLETAHALMIFSSVLPHFWAETVSTATYLISIQPSLALQGGIPFECLCDKTLDYSSLHLFSCVCYVLLRPCEHTKLTAQSLEYVFLGYSTEYKGYCCWDPVSCMMWTSHNIVFDESHPFYPRPITDASLAFLVDPLSFLLFPDAPPASLPIPRSTLPSYVSSFESPPMVLNYMMKPPVTQFYSCCGAHLSDRPAFSDELSSDVPSFSIIEDAPSPPVEPSSLPDCSLEQLVRRSHRLRRTPDCYSPSVFTATALSEPASYRDAIFI
jgi:hypothetical protein